MVAHTRTSLRFDQLRTLNQPQPIQVVCDRQGRPAAIVQHGKRRRIEAIKDHWRLEDEWWRQPIHRHYYLVELSEGSWEVLFCDMLTGRWYRQKERILGHATWGRIQDAVTKPALSAGEKDVR